MILRGHPGPERCPDESAIVTNDRIEAIALTADDTGGTRRVGGRRYLAEDLPTADEIGAIA